ncbi:sarcosine oxidase [Aliidongia dinghuensis]|uniref:Sarcosine oxidase n=1 Tax=Aliidongia dinghuensis TaxID=1867774 RepID=A0A8J2Z0D5_9PROT|nr:FAD-dependent oxidoreductase [Aliidongia dinghuensis]GGF39216.1 sarcosine oxidase [Aliidongia dinghuensis]
MRITIVGAGIMGLTTAWSLAKRGHQVTLLEQGPAIPSPLAASGDQHRMIRRAYGGQSGYARLITEAYDAWDELWADLGTSHYVPAGILCVCQEPGDEADLFRQGFDAVGTPYERLVPDAAAERFRFLDAATFRYAFHTPEGGVLLCRAIAAGLATWLASKGVELRTGERVTGLDAERGRVMLGSGETLDADRVVVTAGAWTLRLLPELATDLKVYRTAVVYLDPPADLAPAWAAAPAILSIGGPSEGYVLPPVAGTGLKFGAGFMKRPADDPEADRTAKPGEGERLRDAFSPPLARVGDYRVRDVVTCAYTFTKDKTFYARHVGRVLAVSACSGHGYKFGAAVGRRVAEAVDGGETDRLRRWLRAELVAA